MPESFEHHFQFSLAAAADKSGNCHRIDYIVADKWLLTIASAPLRYLKAFRDQDRGESLSGRLTPAALTASLLDWHIEDYQAEIADIQRRVDQIDSDVLGKNEQRPPLASLATLRSRVADLRQRLGDHRLVIHGLIRPDFSHIAGHPHAEYFVALERHFDRTEDGLDRAREMIVGSFELYATRTAQDTNELVKVLTLVTVVIGLSSAIAGIFGMNFDTPLTRTGLFGFITTVVGMIGLAGTVFGIARWRRWF